MPVYLLMRSEYNGDIDDVEVVDVYNTYDAAYARLESFDDRDDLLVGYWVDIKVVKD